MVEHYYHPTAVEIPAGGGGVGFGKTTLAKLVYSDDGVERLFELIMWVCV